MNAAPISPATRDGALKVLKTAMDENYVFGKLIQDSTAGAGVEPPCDGWTVHPQRMLDFGYPTFPELSAETSLGKFWTAISKASMHLQDSHTTMPTPLNDMILWQSNTLFFRSRLDEQGNQIFSFTCNPVYSASASTSQIYNECMAAPWNQHGDTAIKSINGKTPLEYIDELAMVSDCAVFKDISARTNCILRPQFGSAAYSDGGFQRSGTFPPSDGNLNVVFADGSSSSGVAYKMMLMPDFPSSNYATISGWTKFSELNFLFRALDRDFGISSLAPAPEPIALSLPVVAQANDTARRLLAQASSHPTACFDADNVKRLTVAGEEPWAEPGSSLNVLHCTWYTPAGDEVQQWFADLKEVTPKTRRASVTGIRPVGAAKMTVAVKYTTFDATSAYTACTAAGCVEGSDTHLYMAKLATQILQQQETNELVIDVNGNSGGSTALGMRTWHYLFGAKASSPSDKCYYTTARTPAFMVKLAQMIKAEAECLDRGEHERCTLQLTNSAYLAELGARLAPSATLMQSLAEARQNYTNVQSGVPAGFLEFEERLGKLDQISNCLVNEAGQVLNISSPCFFPKIMQEQLETFAGSTGKQLDIIPWVAYPNVPSDISDNQAAFQEACTPGGSIARCMDALFSTFLPTNMHTWGGEEAGYTQVRTNLQFCSDLPDDAPQTVATNFKLLSDGTPGSTASVFTTMFYTKRVGTVVTFGGVKGQPMDISSFNGGSVGDWTTQWPKHATESMFWSGVFGAASPWDPTTAAYWPLPGLNAPKYSSNAMKMKMTQNANMLMHVSTNMLPREFYLIPSARHLDIWADGVTLKDPHYSLRCVPRTEDPTLPNNCDPRAADITYGQFSTAPWVQLTTLYAEAAKEPQALFTCHSASPSPVDSLSTGAIIAIIVSSVVAALFLGVAAYFGIKACQAKAEAKAEVDAKAYPKADVSAV